MSVELSQFFLEFAGFDRHMLISVLHDRPPFSKHFGTLHM